MPAYVRPIETHRCEQCGKRATCQVFNTVNALVGWFCTPHGRSRVKLLNDRHIETLVPAEQVQR